MKSHAGQSQRNAKSATAPESPALVASASASWTKTERRQDGSTAQQTTQVWTRYIDSRLKQFCVR